MTVEGILLDDIGGSKELDSLYDALFCVHLQRQYSAARELSAFLESKASESEENRDESEVKYLQALEVIERTKHLKQLMFKLPFYL